MAATATAPAPAPCLPAEPKPAVPIRTGNADKWFYHAPNKPANCDPVPGIILSQIPGLSDQIGDCEDDDATSKRKWIRDTDSDYIKLAKEGGHKNLLTFRERSIRPRKKVTYPRVDWFDHETRPEDMTEQVEVPIPQAPEWYKYDNPITTDMCVEWAHIQDKRTILGYDKLTTWERKDKEILDARMKDKNRRGRLAAKAQRIGTKLPAIDLTKKDMDSEEKADIDMLLKFGYQKQFLDETCERAIRLQQKKEEETVNLKHKAQAEYDRSNRSMLAENTRERKIQGEKPLFKLSKFGNATSKVNHKRAATK